MWRVMWLSTASQKQQRTLPIDTNIRRVLGRLLLGKPFAELKDDDAIQSKADDFLPRRGAYYDVPQAIFDLPTSIFTKNPDCASCPLRQDCKAAKLFLSGRIEIPKRSVAVARERKHRNKSFPDRIYRGRILKLVRERGQVSGLRLGQMIDPDFDKHLDQEWLEDMVDRLV